MCALNFQLNARNLYVKLKQVLCLRFNILALGVKRQNAKSSAWVYMYYKICRI